MTSENNKRIAKNTLFLYFRMMLVMGVSLYTSRIVLKTLGVEDFGIYNVVGGIVTMFSFLNGAMTTGTQRFLSFELGKKDMFQLQRIFSMSVTIHIYIALIIFILAETIGLWFLNTQLNIPPIRMVAANWVYQFSILAFIISIVNVPYNALIVAHEKLHIYAYVSIIEVLLKLGVVYLLLLFNFDKLILYSVLIFCIALLLFVIYKRYSNINFKESRYSYFKDRVLFKSLTSFAGWNLFGATAGILNTQGINILLNIFFGPLVNAARGLAVQIQMALNQFVQSLSQASNPQIIKCHSINNQKDSFDLVFRISKYSFFLMLLISIPILSETETIIKIWLIKIPEHLVPFVRILLLISLIDSISLPLMTLVQAHGNIKLYQIVVGGVQIIVLPIIYILYKYNFEPIVAFNLLLVLSIITLVLRLIFLYKMMNFPIFDFCKQVIYKIILVCVFISMFLYLQSRFISMNYQNMMVIHIFKIILIFAITGGVIFIIGIDKSHKNKVIKRLFNK